jgi:ribosomal protein S18 acetylase RimI-like enzyme
MKIQKALPENLQEVIQFYKLCKADMDRQGIHQWTDKYPNKKIFSEDIKKRNLYLLLKEETLIGAINISEEQEKEYAALGWKFGNEKIVVIHRLAISPKEQGKGYAQLLMNFAEDYALINAYQSIRLDVYSQNARGIKFYQKRDYFLRGMLRFPNREFNFLGMEKKINDIKKK